MSGKSLFLVLAIGIGACAHGTSSPARRGPDVYGYAVRSSRVDPVVVDRAPRVYFRGAWAHLVDGQWVYPTENGWVVFVEEPPELARHRDSADTEQTATDVPSPRGPTIHRQAGADSLLGIP
jgi:hypothetical protein